MIMRSAKNHDLPLPLPPHAPRYLAGLVRGRNTGAISLFRVDNDMFHFGDIDIALMLYSELSEALVAIWCC